MSRRAPAASSVLAIASLPSRAAIISGVEPLVDSALMSAPRSSR
jgi:hypothetical protein